MARRRKLRQRIKLLKRRRISTTVSSEADQEEEPSHARQLPFEVLSEIFLHSIPSTYQRTVKAATLQQWRAFFSSTFPVNLTNVCRSWRHAALNTPGVWSTWYLEVHSPSQKALAIMKRFLMCVLARPDSNKLTCHVRLTGTFDFHRGCDAVRPIMEYQERWEDVDIDVGNQNSEKKTPIWPLQVDIAKLSSLKVLRLTGWQGFHVGFGHGPDFPPSQTAHRMRSLHSLELVKILQLTSFALLDASPNLSELSVHLHESIVAGRSVNLPVLRRLVVKNTGHLRNDAFLPFLNRMECKSLKELSVENILLPFPRHCLDFVNRNELGESLSSLRLQFNPFYEASGEDEDGIFLLLGHATALRELTVYCTLSNQFLSAWSIFAEGRFSWCPLLERLVLGCMKGGAREFTDLVSKRCNGPDRCIKSMAFHGCHVLPFRGPKQLLLHIPGVGSYIQEGLRLEFCKELLEEDGRRLHGPSY